LVTLIYSVFSLSLISPFILSILLLSWSPRSLIWLMCLVRDHLFVHNSLLNAVWKFGAPSLMCVRSCACNVFPLAEQRSYACVLDICYLLCYPEASFIIQQSIKKFVLSFIFKLLIIYNFNFVIFVSILAILIFVFVLWLLLYY
jgi:hypothetical protein